MFVWVWVFTTSSTQLGYMALRAEWEDHASVCHGRNHFMCKQVPSILGTI